MRLQPGSPVGVGAESKLSFDSGLKVTGYVIPCQHHRVPDTASFYRSIRKEPASQKLGEGEGRGNTPVLCMT